MIEILDQQFIIGSTQYGAFLQMYIKIGSNRYTNILLLKSNIPKQITDTDEFVLMSFDFQKHSLLPIPTIMINKIIKAIQHIPFQSQLQEKINKLSYSNKHSNNRNCQKIKLADNFFIMALHASQIAHSQTVEIEFTKDIKINPSSFVFGAFDGMDTYLFLSFNDESLKNAKNWHALTGLRMLINNKSYGEYHLTKIKVIGKNEIAFFCQTKPSIVLRSRKSGVIMENLNIFEITDYLASSAGLSESVSYPENYPKMQNWYTIIIAVDGLEIEQDFGVGSVEFIKKSNEEAIRVITYNKDFDKYKTFALVHVNSEKLYDAFVLGKKQIEQSIDLLINVYKDDSIYNLHSTGQTLMNREFKFFEKKIELSPCIYIESPMTNARLSLNECEVDLDSPLVISKEFIGSMSELNNAELLLIRASGNNDREISPLFNSLKWIRKAWDTNDFDDKIINSIIALEFIVSKEKNIPMMQKPLRKNCKELISQAIYQCKSESEDKEKYIQEVHNKFDRAYTETPFMQKLRNLIERLSIPVSEQDFDLISKAREKRNSIIHGRQDIQIDSGDIYSLCEVISKIAFYKINSLEV